MPRNPSTRTCSSVLFAAGAAALLAAGCASPAPPLGADASNAAAPEPAELTAGARCVTVERGVTGDVKDTRLASALPDRNYGDLATTGAGKVDGKERLSLFQFDLSALPPRARVVRARLTLHGVSTSDAPFTVHRVAASWDEHKVTWNSFEDAFDDKVETTLWTHADKANVAVADITPLVREWVQGMSANHGIVLRSDCDGGPLSLGTFFSSEAKNPADRPRLEVCYEDPAAAL